MSAQDIPKPVKPRSGFPSENAPQDCKINGISMNAKVRIVFWYDRPTFKVRAVKDGDGGEDLTVRFITNTRSSSLCGQWELVSGGEDFTVAFVENGEDFTVRIAKWAWD
jgi:hypothetical protein